MQVRGCTDTLAVNYHPTANVNDKSCNDTCTYRPCHSLAACNRTAPGARSCVCPPGYRGRGPSLPLPRPGRSLYPSLRHAHWGFHFIHRCAGAYYTKFPRNLRNKVQTGVYEIFLIAQVYWARTSRAASSSSPAVWIERPSTTRPSPTTTTAPCASPCGAAASTPALLTSTRRPV